MDVIVPWELSIDRNYVMDMSLDLVAAQITDGMRNVRVYVFNCSDMITQMQLISWNDLRIDH